MRQAAGVSYHGPGTCGACERERCRDQHDPPKPVYECAGDRPPCQRSLSLIRARGQLDRSELVALLFYRSDQSASTCVLQFAVQATVEDRGHDQSENATANAATRDAALLIPDAAPA
jgi:hypothetical protein